MEIVVKKLGLNKEAGGTIRLDKIKAEEVISLRESILDLYFPLETYDESKDRSMDDASSNQIQWFIIPPQILIDHANKINPIQKFPEIIVELKSFEDLKNLDTVSKLREFIKERKLNNREGGIYELWPKNDMAGVFGLNGENKDLIKKQILFIFYPEVFVNRYPVTQNIVYAAIQIFNILCNNPIIKNHNPEIDINTLATIINLMANHLKSQNKE